MWDFRDDSKICDDKLVVAVEQDGGVYPLLRRTS